ncbi:transcript termination protein A18 [BeAn 58058 virus]|uniref:transcript termination protein A18 n=1 Tax=BeAn 58058 virus TaxID=67082 RepID=UPI00090A4C36|nr:transcript termination protein A18 [BeAn 58058 virus]APG58328.1 transcript termination protein A18 [BeAn 58058 virus]
MYICSTLDHKLYTDIMKIINAPTLFLFNSQKEFVEVLPISTFKFFIPIGLFSNEFPLIKNIELIPTNYVNNKDNVTLPTLYPIQKRVVDNILTQLRNNQRDKRSMYMTIHLACGFGKTITTCYLIGIHKRKTVICLPNKMLINQWVNGIKSTNLSYLISLDGATQLLKQLEKNNPDILVIVSRHLSNEIFCKKIFNEYDVFVLDESHMYNLMNNSAITRFLTFYPPKICYFLTATPRSYNRLYCNNVINIYKSSNIIKIIKVYDNFFGVYYTDTIKHMIRKLNIKKTYHIYVEKILSEDANRNKFIIETIVKDYSKKYINRVILVTKLRSHMLYFYNILIEKFDNETVYLGDAKDKNTPDIVNLLRKKDRFIFISTVNYSGTGLDIPRLDSIIVTCTVLNSMQIEQLFGRICRETEDIFNRVIYLFQTTSIREISNTVGYYTQKMLSLSIDKLGFVKEKTENIKHEPALYKAFNLQNH